MSTTERPDPASFFDPATWSDSALDVDPWSKESEFAVDVDTPTEEFASVGDGHDSAIPEQAVGQPVTPAKTRRERRREARALKQAAKRRKNPDQRRQAAERQFAKEDRSARPRRNKAMELRLRGVNGHITRTNKELRAWFVEPPGAWSMRPVPKQAKAIEDHALVYGHLAEQGVAEIHKRTVREAWPVGQWARNHNEWANPLPDTPGTLGWEDYLVGHQVGLMNTNTTLKRVYWGIPLSERTVSGEFAEKAAELIDRWPWFARTKLARTVLHFADTIFEREIESLREELDAITRTVYGKGVRAVQANARQMDHLLYRSATIGLPIPATNPVHVVDTDEWHEGDLRGLLDAAKPTVTPGDGYVKVTGTVEGAYYERYVVILTIGRMGKLPIPETMLPWMVKADAERIPLEWEERVRLIPASEVRRGLTKQVNKVMSQWRHYTVEHNEVPPQELKEQLHRANAIKADLDDDHSLLSSRVEGWFRVAVTGDSPKDVLDKVARIRSLYKPAISIEHEDGQYQLLREFIPGEPLANTAHRRRMSVYVAAAGMPSVSDRIGDRTGVIMGETASISARPVVWETHAGPERLDKSGLTPLVAVPGGGKTDYAGMVTYQSVRAGVRSVILDPSGPLQNLAAVPELAPHTRLYNLTKESIPGALNPYKVIIDPIQSEYGPGQRDPALYNADLLGVQAERQQFVGSVLKMMLPPSLLASGAADVVLDEAIRQVGGDNRHTPLEVIEALRDVASSEEPELRRAAMNVAAKLDSIRHLSEARVIFPSEGIDGWAELGDEYLTILTMPGIQIPDREVDREDWTPQQRLAVPLIHIAAWQANRLIYERPRHERKLLFLDENKFLDSFGASRTLHMRVARDSRKYDVRALVADQLPDSFLGLGDGHDNSALSFETIIGELGTNSSAVGGALRLLNLPTGEGYEAVIGRLGRQEDVTLDPESSTARNDHPREFVIRMGDDIEVVRADWSQYKHLRHVRAALNSRPGQARRLFN